MADKEAIKDFSGKIRGYIHTSSNGDKKITDFSGKVLGYYKKSTNVTTRFDGKVVARGDASSSLILDLTK